MCIRDSSWDPNVIAFERRDAHGGRVVVISNFAGVERSGHRLALPIAGVWQEILNTDASEYGGRGSGNLGMVVAHSDDDGPAVATLTIPALSTIWLRHEGEPHVPTISHG